MARLTETLQRPFRAVARATLGNEYRDMAHMSTLFREGLRYQPWTWMQDTVQARLREMNPDSLRWLQQLQGWETLGSGMGSAYSGDERDRLRGVNSSRWAFDHLILIDRMVNMWTDFAFGQNVSVSIKDPEGNACDEAMDCWDDFWTSRENSYILSPSRLYKLSNKLLLDGELFWPFYVSTIDGSVQIRQLDTTQITTIISEPEDDSTIIGYERQSVNSSETSPVTRYYRDWRWEPERLANVLQTMDMSALSRGGILAAGENEATDVIMMHVAWKGQGTRGWPQFSQAVWWAYMYQQFLLWRLTLDRAVATFWEDIETQGGSRATAYFNTLLQSTLATGNSLETNPASPVATPFVHNQGIKRQRMPLGTGAGDAELDGLVLCSYVGLVGGIPPHWLGRPDALQNRATAEELLRPVMRQWARYQLMWSNTWREVVTLVLEAGAMYPRGNGRQYGWPIDELDIDVTMDTPTDADFDSMVTALVQFAQSDILSKKDASSVAVRQPQFGFTDPQEILDRMYPEEEESGEEPEVPETPEPSGAIDMSNLTAEQRAILEAAARLLTNGAYQAQREGDDD